MSEALDLSVRSHEVIVSSSPSSHIREVPRYSEANSIESPPSINNKSFPFEQDFMPGFQQFSPTIPPGFPSINFQSFNPQPLQTPPTAIQMGADAISKLASMMMPTPPTQTADGVTLRDDPPNAIDLSRQILIQPPQFPPGSESIMNFGSSLPQNQMLVNQGSTPIGTTNGFSPSEYFPLVERIPRVSTMLEGKDLLKKFSSFIECGHDQCRVAGLKEHFHCIECYKVIYRREENIRHAKWHRKRAESLQYGFMRYSSSDDCEYPNCSHNLKQTHYHCIRTNCNKTYISTSDVQMHANFHRKDAVIMQEGFRRFRAAEDCGSIDCTFYRERTTHFHCQRPGCKFTFKNKADMEKHKNHHLKNDAIAKDGFRKFTKSENCIFANCKFSGKFNHIHCIRQGCDYVVSSTSQISSHRRKHERRESINYPSTGILQNQHGLPQLNCDSSTGEAAMAQNNTTSTTTATTSGTATPKPSPPQSVSPSTDPQSQSSTENLLQRVTKISEICWQRSQEDDNNPSTSNDFENTQLVKQIFEEIKRSLKIYKDVPCCGNDQCSFYSTGIDHFHCFRTGCMDTLEMDPEDKFAPVGDVTTISSGDMDSWRDHWHLHAWQSILSIIGFSRCSGEICNSHGKVELHLHCFQWPSCNFSIDINVADPPRLLRHLTKHNPHFGTMMHQIKEQTGCMTSELSQRKRGRPPKHSRDIHIPRLDIPPERCQDDNPSVPLRIEDFLSKPDMIAGGFKFFPVEEGVACVDRCCPHFISGRNHFHCIRPRCYLATPELAYVNAHRREFHPYIPIEPGYEHFDRSIDCRRPACYAKRDSAHYHCLRPRCTYSFVRVGKMRQHTELHEVGLNGTGNGAYALGKCEEVPDNINPTVGAILPPLGLDKNAESFTEFVPLLMQILNNVNVMQFLNPENMESAVEKMDWSEMNEKMESANMLQAEDAPLVTMEVNEQGPVKAESNEDNA